MNLRKVINRRFHRADDDVQIAGDINAVVSANVGEPSAMTKTSQRRHTRVVQRSGKTVVSETHESEAQGGDRMTDEDRTPETDLESQEGQPLPSREVMSIIWPEADPLPAAESGAQPEEPAPHPRDGVTNEPLRGGEPS